MHLKAVPQRFSLSTTEMLGCHHPISGAEGKLRGGTREQHLACKIFDQQFLAQLRLAPEQNKNTYHAVC